MTVMQQDKATGHGSSVKTGLPADTGPPAEARGEFRDFSNLIGWTPTDKSRDLIEQVTGETLRVAGVMQAMEQEGNADNRLVSVFYNQLEQLQRTAELAILKNTGVPKEGPWSSGSSGGYGSSR